MRYGDKRIIFKDDADADIVVAGHFFQVVACVSVSCLHCMDAIKRTQSERKNRAFTHRCRPKLFPSFRKMFRWYVKYSGRHLEHLW